ncbi:GNAT family N-acetyltransferase [Streptomyces sp. HNM0574]|uniref:GNAT family N-acetyltransferase n=1 Tax=Streptomyces sp. HNM0574 TaxID=2714954 RepID=UPI00146C14D2|nr:GNAT family N-acetyltransferase [Streptomyces sp. HNM0574]NLU67993.1 GNAT family N-acetyltransferase [Streptomyces sp. HNM0574]
MALDIRTLDRSPDDFLPWLRAIASGFLRSTDVSEEEAKVRWAKLDAPRAQGAFEDDGRCVGTYSTFPHQLTVPGGTELTSCAVSAVTVAPTHRRRGLLTRMMGAGLDAAKERGEVCASLVAAEYRIYGRYGFGPSAWMSEFDVDVARSGVDTRNAAPDDGGRVDFASPAEIRAEGPGVHERFRRGPQSQGAVDRDTHWWQLRTGELRFPHDGYNSPFYALYRDADGVPQGLVEYTVEERWTGQLPDYTAKAQQLIGATPAAERALWYFLMSIDWVTHVHSGMRGPDDPLPHFLPDPRAARVLSTADYLWLRPLDVPAMLRARHYPAEGELVLEVRDEAGYAGGRFRLEAGPEGASCDPVTDGRSADLTLHVSELARLYLGDEPATRRVRLGAVEEHRAGAAARADTLFRTPVRPWCPDNF